jgi:hypothetical protein
MLVDAHWYIGATDIQQSKVWRWVDVDKPMQVNIWDRKQPDFNFERCAELRWTGSGNYRMNNIGCGSKLPSVCEYELF